MVLSLEPPPDAVLPHLHPDAPPPGTVLPQHFSGCYACGDDVPTGLHLRATVGDGLTVSTAFTVTEAHQGAPGLAHGGILATALDETLGFLMWLLATPAVTARLEVDFRAPVPVGSVLSLRSECVGVLRRKVYLRATGLLPNGTVALNARALFLAVPLEHFAQHGTDPGLAAVPGGRWNP